MKDHTTRDSFDVVTQHMKTVQFNSTLECEYDRKRIPKLQHFMFTYDKMVEKPHKAVNSRFERQKPVCSFLTPEGV